MESGKFPPISPLSPNSTHTHISLWTLTPLHTLNSLSPWNSPQCSNSPLYWFSLAIRQNRGTSSVTLTSDLVSGLQLMLRLRVFFIPWNKGFRFRVSLNLFMSFFILFFTIIFLILCLYFSQSYDSIGNWGFTVTRVSTAFHFNWGFDLLGFKVKSSVILCFSL